MVNEDLHGPRETARGRDWRATSGPLLAVGLGVAAVAALNGDERGSQLFVPAAVFASLFVGGSGGLPTLLHFGRGGGRPPATGSVLYGLLAVISLVVAVLLPIGLALGPINMMALGLGLLAFRARDPWLGVAGGALLVAPIDVRGAIAVFDGVSGERVMLQIVTACALMTAATVARHRVRRSGAAAHDRVSAPV